MKQICAVLTFFLCYWQCMYAQSKMLCTYTDVNTQKKTQLKFTREEKKLTDGNFETSYLVIDEKGYPFKAIVVTNNTSNKRVDISVREMQSGKVEVNYSRVYNEFSGLIFNGDTDSIAELPLSYNNKYLVSFDDASKTYVGLHFLSNIPSYTFNLSSVSNDIIKQNAALLLQVHNYKVLQRAEREKAQQQQEFLHQIDSIADVKIKYAMDSISEKRRVVNEVKQTNSPPQAIFSPSFLAANILIDAEMFYKKLNVDSMYCNGIKKLLLDIAQKKKPKLLSNPDKNFNYRVGHKEWRKKSDYEYFGEVGGPHLSFKHGTGFLRHVNGDYFLGEFRDAFYRGAAKVADTLGVYFGSYEKYKRNGYVEFYFSNSDIAIGFFEKGVIKEGYVRRKESAVFNYFYIQNGKAKEQDNLNGEYVFSKVASLRTH